MDDRYQGHITTALQRFGLSSTFFEGKQSLTLINDLKKLGITLNDLYGVDGLSAPTEATFEEYVQKVLSEGGSREKSFRLLFFETNKEKFNAKGFVDGNKFFSFAKDSKQHCFTNPGFSNMLPSLANEFLDATWCQEKHKIFDALKLRVKRGEAHELTGSEKEQLGLPTSFQFGEATATLLKEKFCKEKKEVNKRKREESDIDKDEYFENLKKELKDSTDELQQCGAKLIELNAQLQSEKQKLQIPQGTLNFVL